jgi:hypothetical protein
MKSERPQNPENSEDSLIHPTGLDRRHFLKLSTAAVTAAATLPAVSVAEARPRRSSNPQANLYGRWFAV